MKTITVLNNANKPRKLIEESRNLKVLIYIIYIIYYIYLAQLAFCICVVLYILIEMYSPHLCWVSALLVRQLFKINPKSYKSMGKMVYFI